MYKRQRYCWTEKERDTISAEFGKGVHIPVSYTHLAVLLGVEVDDLVDDRRAARGVEILPVSYTHLKDPVKIGERLDVVEKFVRDADLADVVREQVALVGDMERIASRIAAARVTPRELVQLKNSLFAVELLKAALESTDDAQLHALAGQIDLLEGVRDRIAREIYPDPVSYTHLLL